MERVYETGRLLLRVLDETNTTEVLDYLLRNREFLAQCEPQRDKKFYTADFQADQLKNDLNYIKGGSMLRLWISMKDEPDRIIGEVTFYNIVPFAFLGCHAGYKSDKDEINKGIITEALKKGIDIMFKDYRMHRIEAYVMPDNKSSLRVLDKLKFIYEGTACKFLEVNGVWRDHLHFSLVNEDM